MGDFLIALLITLATLMIPVINYSSDIDTTSFQAFVQSKTVALYYYFCEIAELFLVANFELVMRCPS